MFEHAVELIVPRVRVACPRCGPKLERLAWLGALRAGDTCGWPSRGPAVQGGLDPARGARSTAWTGRRSRTSTAPAWSARWGRSIWTASTVIVLDEFAIQKGHRYATVIVEPMRKRVLWVGPRPRPRGHPAVLRTARARSAAERAAGGGHGHERRLRAGGAAPTARTPRSSTTCSTSWPSTAARSSTGCASTRPTAARGPPGRQVDQGRALAAAAEPRLAATRPGRHGSTNCWRPTTACSSSTC